MGFSGERQTIGFRPPRHNGNEHAAELATRLAQYSIDLEALKEKIKGEKVRGQERFKVKPLDVYLDDRVKKAEELGHPSPFEYVPAAGAIRRAIESQEVIIHPWGKEFGFFTKRSDEYRVVGNGDLLEGIVDFLAGHEKRTENTGKILLIIGKPGSGKSTVVDALKAGFEEYSRNCEPAISAISDCPVNENPLNALHPPDLCPDCQQRLKKEFEHDPNQIPVVALDISNAQGIGVTKLTPTMTSYYSPDIVNQLIRASNRGILDVNEYSQHPQGFRKDLGEVMSSNRLQVVSNGRRPGETRRQEYRMDHVVIATTTYDEWEALRTRLEKDNPGELRRIKEVYWTFVTSPSDEVEIYKKTIELSDLNPHVSPQTLDALARIALRTRLVRVEYKKGDETLKVGPEEKLELYDGRDIGKLTQQDRQKIQKISRGEKEGLNGIPPTFMTEIVSSIMTAHPECITPVEALRECRDFIGKNPAKLPPEFRVPAILEGLVKLVEIEATNYEVLLVKIVKQAMRGDYETAAQTQFNAYLDEAEAFVNKKKIIVDLRNKEEREPNEHLMRKIEEQGGITENNKREFREQTLMNYSTKVREKQRGNGRHQQQGKVELSYAEFPELKDALERIVTGVSEEDAERIILSQLGLPHPDQQKRLDETRDRMVEHHGFCPHCVQDSLLIAAKVIHKKRPTKTA